MLCLHHRALSANASMVPALGPGSPRRHHTLSSTTPQLHLQPWGTPRCTSRHGVKRMEQAISHGPGDSHPAPHALVWVRAMEPASMARPAPGTHWKSPPQGAGRLIAVLPTRQHSVLPAQTAGERSSHSSTPCAGAAALPLRGCGAASCCHVPFPAAAQTGCCCASAALCCCVMLHRRPCEAGCSWLGRGRGRAWGWQTPWPLAQGCGRAECWSWAAG
jgi:hypothetical protein